jgi:hypothetical protein
MYILYSIISNSSADVASNGLLANSRATSILGLSIQNISLTIYLIIAFLSVFYRIRKILKTFILVLHVMLYNNSTDKFTTLIYMGIIVT